MDYFLSGLYVDLADLHSNARDGVHIASTGGVWNALIYGFGGMRDHGGNLTFDPRLPKDWQSLGFQLQVRGSKMKVNLTRASITFEVVEGGPVELSVRGKAVSVQPGEISSVVLDGHGPQLPSLHGTHPVVGHRRADGSVIQAVVPEAGED